MQSLFVRCLFASYCGKIPFHFLLLIIFFFLCTYLWYHGVNFCVLFSFMAPASQDRIMTDKFNITKFEQIFGGLGMWPFHWVVMRVGVYFRNLFYFDGLRNNRGLLLLLQCSRQYAGGRQTWGTTHVIHYVLVTHNDGTWETRLL